MSLSDAHPSQPSSSIVPGRIPGWVWISLILLLAAGAAVRFHNLANQSLWLDEYSPLYIATGLGQPGSSVFTAPTGVVFDPPPPVNLSAALPWWHIWTGIDSELHPPLYYIVLRWWMDVFREGDFATRSLSAVFGLADALLLFEIIYRIHGARPALLAAALLLFPLSQLDLSREIRSYTMLVFLGLLCCRTVLLIERRGVSGRRIILLGLATFAMQMTHYFAAGYLIGLALYVTIRFRGRPRAAALSAMIAAAIVVAVTWTPLLLRQRHIVADPHYPPKATTSQILTQLTNVPMVLTCWFDPQQRSARTVLFILVCLLPLFTMRRSPDALLWWLWLICGIGLVAACDVARQTFIVYFHKYLLPAAPAMCALLATQLPLRGRAVRFIAPLYVVVCFAAVWKILQLGMGTSDLLDPTQSSLIMMYIALLALGVIAARAKNSWAAWILAAVIFLMPLHVALQYPFSYPMGFAYFAPLAAYILFVATAPASTPSAWLPSAAAWAVVAWSIASAAHWVAQGSVVISKNDWREITKAINANAAPHDVVAFTSATEFKPSSCYIVYRHYAPDSPRPVMFLQDSVPSAATLRDLAQRPSVWVVGASPESDTRHFFPGWGIGSVTTLSELCSIWQVIPPDEPSHTP